jgi:hypothetical protein
MGELDAFVSLKFCSSFLCTNEVHIGAGQGGWAAKGQ